MKAFTIKKTDRNLTGTIRLPSSKSISNRLLIIRALASAGLDIENLSEADDTLLLLDLLKKIRSHQGNTSMTELDTGNAGTAMRFLTAYLSMVPGKWILTGSERMKQRPIGILVDGLKSMGAQIDYLSKLGYPPVMIHGTSLKGRELIVDPGISSQFVSALIMIGPKIPGGLTLHLSGHAVSFPYVKMTIGLLKNCGIHVSQDRSRIFIPEGNYIPCAFSVESDWSAAAFWYEAAALADHVDLELLGLTSGSLQGDSVISEIFKAFNVETEFTAKGIRLTKSSQPLSGNKFTFNFSDHPDIAPAVITTCAMLGLNGLFTGLKNLQIKESDRLLALKTEYEKIGIITETYSTGNLIPAIEIKGSNFEPRPGLQFSTYGDHRMAMTFAPLALMNGEICIENPEVVTKSYPGFWNDFVSAGFEITEQDLQPAP
ncbi:MAG: 3-phosphoshikimate 1-carboxyvinyltransferase [Bacteroidetes bacterium]|nr:3-phosphoshikimate 1-carboxyvinyltransferase [Bacteroidota bacterium]